MKKKIRKIIVAVAGTIVTLVGVAMIVLPGPAFIVIPAGLAILATEFEWAEKLLHKMKEKFKEQIEKVKKKTHPNDSE
ncbi:MAG: PGPGW domain-containing protein [Ignavibacteria bacterium]